MTKRRSLTTKKTKYTYSNEKEYLSDTSNVEGGDVRGFILQYLFVDLFHTPEPYEGTLWQTVKHLRFSEENFSSDGNLVTFSLSYPTESANVKLSGVLDLKSFDLLLSVEQIYTDPSISPCECAYTVSLKTHDVEDIVFDTSRDFTESIDVKSR